MMRKENERTLIGESNLRAGKDLTMLYNKSILTLLADIFEIFIATCYKEGKIDPIYFLSLPAYTWDADLENTRIELENIEEAGFFDF